MKDRMMTANVTMGEGVVLALDTYNELLTRSRLLDSIVAQTLQTVSISAAEPSKYNRLRVEMTGNLVLPQVVLDHLTDAIGARLAVEDDDYIRSLFESGVHKLDLSDFTFESYQHINNTLEIDLLKSADFNKRWKAEEIYRKGFDEQSDAAEPGDASCNEVCNEDHSDAPTLDDELDRLAAKYGTEYLAEHLLDHPSDLASIHMAQVESGTSTE